MTDTPETTESTPTPDGNAGGAPNPVMCILSYFGIFALIPYFVEKDPFIQWHARQGIVLMIVFFVVAVGFGILASIVPLIGILGLVINLGWLVISIIAILKAIKGEKWPIPVVSGFIDKIPART